MKQYWQLIQSKDASSKLQDVEVTFRKPVEEMTDNELMAEIKTLCG